MKSHYGKNKTKFKEILIQQHVKALSFVYLTTWTSVIIESVNSIFRWCGVLLQDLYQTVNVVQLLCSLSGWLHLNCSSIGTGFNAAETNCRIACNLGILLMNSNCFAIISSYVCSDIYFIKCQIPEVRWPLPTGSTVTLSLPSVSNYFSFKK